MSLLFLKSFSFVLLLSFSGCGVAQSDDKKKVEPKNSDEELIEQNREFLKQERKKIEAFISKNGFIMQQTGSGLYYMSLSESTLTGDIKIEEGDRIGYNYRIALLDGTPVANSSVNGSRALTLGKEQAEVGLYEALLLMNLGDHYLFIMPSHLAHGISQNEDDVPLRSTLIYELEPLKKLN